LQYQNNALGHRDAPVWDLWPMYKTKEKVQSKNKDKIISHQAAYNNISQEATYKDQC